MSLTRVLRFSVFFIILASAAAVSAQVPVEVSAEKMVSGGRVYYLHEVQKSQTLYSISRAYKVTIDVITRENVIPPSGIQTGQVLRIPVPDQQPVAGTQTRPSANRTTTQQTPVSQAQRTVIISDVPGINISREKIVTGGKTFYLHEVEKGQTLYSLAKAYKVTILDIDRENSIPPGGLQAGQVLKIPVSSALTVIEEKNIPAEKPSVPERTDTSKPGTTRGTAPAGTNMPRQETQVPRQETVRQENQMPRQETVRQEAQLPRQETQVPRQEQPAAKQQPAQQDSGGSVTFRTGETKVNNQPETQPETKTTPDSNVKQETNPQQAQAPAGGDEKPRTAQPEKKKIHKVQKGESLAEIAKKYGITVQELKQANRGVIFAMPDMRLVIPVSDEEQSDKK
jgi:LysM repeat protein